MNPEFAGGTVKEADEVPTAPVFSSEAISGPQPANRMLVIAAMAILGVFMIVFLPPVEQRWACVRESFDGGALSKHWAAVNELIF